MNKLARSLNDYDDLELRGLSALAAHMAYIRALDDVLDGIDKLLNRYQPRRTGKIRIERWKRGKGEHSVSAPMAVQWIQDYSTLRWRGIVISTFKLSRSGKSAREFHEHHDRVKRYLKIAQKVLQLRSEAFTRVETFRRSTTLSEDANLPEIMVIWHAIGEELDESIEGHGSSEAQEGALDNE